MARPLVAIVGRPNVGKSSLFNRFLGARVAIVEETAGVTRDRLVRPVHMEDPELEFDVMDTGGLGIVDRADLAEAVEFQVLTGVHAAEVLIFLVDAREGLTPLDQKVATILRRTGHTILLAANKCEGADAEANLGEFSSFGLGSAMPLSALEGRGLADLYDRLEEMLPAAATVSPAPGGALRVAVLGRRNTGKSSFINRLVGEQRVIVSDIPGTTRDAVEVDFEWKGRPLCLVDTAGVHRRSKLANAVEFFSLTRSDQAVRRADVALLFLDLTDSAARLDQELARTILDRHKPVVVIGNKVDLADDEDRERFAASLDRRFPHLSGSPVRMISCLTGQGVGRVVDAAFSLHEEAGKRLGTGELNRILHRTMEKLSFRGRGEKPQILYGTQVRTHPPTLLLFVNRSRLFTKEVLRAVTKELRRKLGFPRVPLRLVLRDRKRDRR